MLYSTHFEIWITYSILATDNTLFGSQKFESIVDAVHAL